MDFNIDIRKKQLESLDQFLTSSKNKLQSVLNSLGWSVEKIEKEKEFVVCPYNNGHKVPVQSIVRHVEKCKIKHAGYDHEEAFLSEPANHPQGRSITLNNAQKITILSQAILQTPFFQPAWNGQDPNPQTYSRLMTTFSRDERLTLYDHCISNTKGPSKLPEFDVSVTLKQDETDGQQNSEKALMSFERDMKRRSVKYKPIHTNHKNYKEVLREVINSQMLQYTDWLAQSKSFKGPHTPEYSYDEQTETANISSESVDRPHSSLSKISNHSSKSHSRARRREKTPDRPYDYKNKRHDRKNDVSSYSKHRSVNKYKNSYDDEDSQDSKSTSYDGSTFHRTEIRSDDYFEYSSKSHSRDSSGHSSHKYNDEYRRHKKSDRKYRSKSPSGSQIDKSHHRHRSRSRHKHNSHKSRREKCTDSN